MILESQITDFITYSKYKYHIRICIDVKKALCGDPHRAAGGLDRPVPLSARVLLAPMEDPHLTASWEGVGGAAAADPAACAPVPALLSLTS